MNTKKEKKNKNYGEPAPYDPTFSGPLLKRSFTDIFCCIVFIAFILGHIFISGAAWLFGNHQYIVYNQNSAGETCGTGRNFDKPYVFHINVMKCESTAGVTAQGFQCPSTQVCVKQCPSIFWFLSADALNAGGKPSEVFQQEFCDPSLNLAETTFTVKEIVDKELCPAYYTPSKQVQGICLARFDPKHVIADFAAPGVENDQTVDKIINATSLLSSGFKAKSMKVRIVADLVLTWLWIMIGLVIALMASMVLLALMRCCVKVMAIFLMLIVLAVGAYGIYQCHHEYRKNMNSNFKFGDLNSESEFSDYLQVKEIWLTCMVILVLLEFILLMLFISFIRRGLVTVMEMMGQCSKAIGVMLSIMAYPLITFLLVILFVTFCTVTSINLATSGFPVYKKVALDSSKAECGAITGKEKCDPKTFKASDYPDCPVRCVFNDYDDENVFIQRFEKPLQAYNCLVSFWCLYFIITLGQCALARTFATYYWTLSKPHNIARSILTKSLFHTLGYHTGSMAFGAIFLTMFQGIRIVLEYLRDVTRDGKRFYFYCYPLKILLKFWFWVLDNFIRYANRNTYVMMAIYGDNYFVSAKNTYALWGRNKDRVALVDWVTDLLLFFGRLLVSGAIGVLAYCFFSGDIRVPTDTFQAESLNYLWLPIIVVMVGAYFIAQGCFSVYSIGVDTFTFCVMDDLERNDGTLQRPYMSKSMMQILQNHREPFNADVVH